MRWPSVWWLALALVWACSSSRALAQEVDLVTEGLPEYYGDVELEGRPESRRLFSLWSSLLFVIHPCPPIGPEHSKCTSQRSSSGGGGSGGGSSGGSSSGGGGGGSGGGGGGGGGSSGGGSGSGGSSSHAESSSGSNPKHTSAISNMSKTTFWMLMVAAVASMFAIGAIIVGQRKTNKDPHPLSGSVARRMGLFSNFADSTLCSNAQRPARVVEMTEQANNGGDDYGMV